MISLKVDEINICEFFKPVFSSFLSAAESKHINYTCHLPGEAIRGWIDQDKVEKILNNLLFNAFKFTPEKGEVAVEVLHLNKNEVKITICDSGPGIPTQCTDLIFDRFYQCEDPQKAKTEGSGIGLALTKELVEFHHGHITVESTPGKGSCFSVVLPIGKDYYSENEVRSKDIEPLEKESLGIPDPSVGHSQSNTAADAVKHPKSTKQRSIQVLIVEDNADVRYYLRQHLKEQYLIREAIDGEDGFHEAVRNIPDLVICDVIMPKVGGVELCRQLKSDERTSHIPVIFLTAKADQKSKLEGLEKGADAYITKPFDLAELKVLIKNLILQRRKLQHRFSREVNLQPVRQVVTSLDDQFLMKALKLVEDHVSDADFSVELFASQMGMSRSQLFRKIMALTDMSPSEFLKTIRLKRAAQLLKQNFGNVSQIAYEVGFTSPSYFSKSFHNFFHQSPKEYANQFESDN